MPAPPHRQLTKRDLGSFDYQLLNAIEAIADSHPYLGDIGHRNDLILDTELRNSNALTHFFKMGEISVLQLGYDLAVNGRAWERVPNTVFFNAIRMAWKNFTRKTAGDQGRTSSSNTTVRNADVVWLEN
jgi:hypothetical protein